MPKPVAAPVSTPKEAWAETSWGSSKTEASKISQLRKITFGEIFSLILLLAARRSLAQGARPDGRAVAILVSILNAGSQPAVVIG